MSAVRQFRPGRLSQEEVARRCQECTEEQEDLLFVQQSRAKLEKHRFVTVPSNPMRVRCVQLMISAFVTRIDSPYACMRCSVGWKDGAHSVETAVVLTTSFEYNASDNKAESHGSLDWQQLPVSPR